MYGYGNVSNHLSFVPSSGKSASKGFDTCERNHAAPIKGSSREAPGAARHAPGCAASRERGRPHLPPRLDLLLEVDQRIAPREGAAAHAGRLQRQRTAGPPNAGAGARSRSRSAETRRACLYWVPLRGAAEPSSEQVRELKPHGVRTICVCLHQIHALLFDFFRRSVAHSSLQTIVQV